MLERLEGQNTVKKLFTQMVIGLILVSMAFMFVSTAIKKVAQSAEDFVDAISVNMVNPDTTAP